LVVVGDDVPVGGHVVGEHPGGCWKVLTRRRVESGRRDRSSTEKEERRV
jgi:hypothetical protein